MSLFLIKSIMLYYIPPHSEQRHSTQDLDVIYRYNNYALRGEDIDFNNKFDIVYWVIRSFSVWGLMKNTLLVTF